MKSQAEKLHECILIIAEEIKRICIKNEIKYFLIGGSLLGSLRHNGFIPWDDDMDIGMLRKDYEKFVSVASRELKSDYFISSIDSEKNYGLPFVKIRLKGTHFRESIEPLENEDGIFVDIFPIDRIPDWTVSRTIQSLELRLYKRALLYKCHYRVDDSSQNKVIVAVTKMLGLLPKEYISRKLKKVQQKYNNKHSKMYANLCSSYAYGKEVFPCDTLDKECIMADFEENEYPISPDADRILNLLYGDYMKLPPEEKRIFRHATKDIVFGQYEE